MRYFLFQKNKLSVLENLSTPLLRPLKSSRADWHQHQKVGAHKLEKREEGCVGFRDPNFLNGKNQGVRCKKLFENWLRVKIKRF